MDTIYSVDEIRNILFPVFARYHINKAILFGSYSKNSAFGTSDVDLCVDSGLRGLTFVDFTETLRDILHKDVDVLDVAHIEPNSLVAKEIARTGVVVYEK